MLVAQRFASDRDRLVEQRLRLGVFAGLDQHVTEARGSRAHVRVLGTERRAAHVQRLARRRDRAAHVAAREIDEGDVQQRDRHRRVVLAEQLAVDRKRVAIGRLGLVEATLAFQDVGQVVQARRGLRVLLAVELALHLQREPHQRFGFLHLADFDQDRCEVVDGLRVCRVRPALVHGLLHRRRLAQLLDGRVVFAAIEVVEAQRLQAAGDLRVRLGAVELALDGERFADGLLGPGVIAFRPQQVGVDEQRVRDRLALGAEQRPADLQRLGEPLFRFGEVRAQREHFAQVVEARSRLLVRGAEDFAARQVGLSHQRHRGVVEAQAGVDAAHRVHQRGLDRGLAGQLAVDALRALVEDLARRDGVAEGLARVRHLEQVDHEARRLAGGLRLGFGADPLALGVVAGEPRRARERGGDRHARNRRGRQDHGLAMTPVCFALLEFVESDPDHASHQLQPDVELAVLARAQVCRDRLRRFVGEAAVRAHPEDQCRRKTLLVGGGGVR